MKAKLKCPHCGSEMVKKMVEKLLRGGMNTAVVKSKADVCLHCGERLYSLKTARLFEQVREKLQKRDFSHLKPLGRTFQAA